MTERRRAMIRALLITTVLSGCVSEGMSARPVYAINGEQRENVAQDNYQAGIGQLAAGRYGLALQHFFRALRAEPERVDVLSGIAITYLEMGRYNIARQFFDRALTLEPNSPATLNNIGRSYIDQERWSEAVAPLQRAHILAPGNQVIENNYELAKAHLRQSGPSPTRLKADAAPVVGPRVERTSLSEQTLSIGDVSAIDTGQHSVLAPTRSAHAELELADGSNPDGSPIQLAEFSGHVGPRENAGSVAPPTRTPGPVALTPANDQPIEAGAVPSAAVDTIASGETELTSRPAGLTVVNSAVIDMDDTVIGLTVTDDFGHPGGAARTADLSRAPVMGTYPVTAAIITPSAGIASPSGDPASATANIANVDDAPTIIAIGHDAESTVAAGAHAQADPNARQPAREPRAKSPLSIVIEKGAHSVSAIARVRHYVQRAGLGDAHLTVSNKLTSERTVVRYRPRASNEALRIVAMLPGAVEVQLANNPSADIRLTLGSDARNINLAMVTSHEVR